MGTPVAFLLVFSVDASIVLGDDSFFSFRFSAASACPAQPRRPHGALGGGDVCLAVRFYLADAFRSIVNRISCWLSVLRALGVLSSVFLSPFAAFASPLPQRFVPLQEELKRQGFAIVFMHPANKSDYATYDAKE